MSELLQFIIVVAFGAFCFCYTPEAIDPVLVEVLAAAHFLQLSPDIGRLEDHIRSEL